MPAHVFNGGTCVYCYADDHDVDLPDGCPVTEGRVDKWTFEAGRNDMETREAEDDQALREYSEKKSIFDQVSDA
jgi:hypothetical protein